MEAERCQLEAGWRGLDEARERFERVKLSERQKINAAEVEIRAWREKLGQREDELEAEARRLRVEWERLEAAKAELRRVA